MYKKRFKEWSPECLTKLNDEDFISVFATAVEDRTILKTGYLEFENKLKQGAPLNSIELLSKEAERRNIPLSLIAKKFKDNAFAGKSFISNLCAPKSWKRYEIHAAGALLTILKGEKVDFGSYEFDAKIIGKTTKSERQIDLLLKRLNPIHIVACEFKNYQTRTISIDRVEALATKLKDINANKGVMITGKGYQKGAIQVANKYGIVLFIFKEIEPNNLKLKYPDKLDKINDYKTYWLFETIEGMSWVFSGKLTE